jgi:hypothetical protein
MTLFIAYNTTIDATTGVMSPVSYTSGAARISIQIAPPSGTDIRLVEWGVSFNGNALASPATCTLAQASAASTVTAHSDTTIKAVGDREVVSGMTFGTSATGYGSGSQAITTNTTEKQFAGALVGPLSQYEKQFPLGRDFVVTGGKFCQLRISVPATISALSYIAFEKC